MDALHPRWLLLILLLLLLLLSLLFLLSVLFLLFLLPLLDTVAIAALPTVKMPPKNNYKSTLIRFMTYRDNVEYEKDHEFSDDDLGAITPAEVTEWMATVAYGVAVPGPDDNPTGARSNTIKFHKKAISSFMPNKMMEWNRLAGAGNPTKSQEVNDLIKDMKRKEVRKQGRPSQARRALKDDEYRHLIDLLRASVDGDTRTIYGIPALVSFQFHMLARVDDACHWTTEHLRPHTRFPEQAVRVRLHWSKNCNEERDAPWQTMLGAMNTYYCVMINVGIWLEVSLASAGAGLNPHVFGFANDFVGGDRAKNWAQAVCRELYRGGDFDVEEGPLGTHSVRKHGSSTCRNQGVSMDDKNTRGRWRAVARRSQSDNYDDPELPFVDTKVASVLCMGGACSYVAHECITQQFTLQQSTPRIREKYGEHVALVMGRALIWLAFSEESALLPPGIKTRILENYAQLPNKLADGINPVKRKLLIVSGHDNEVQLTELNEDGGNGNGNGHLAGGAMQQHQLLQALMAQMATMQNSILELHVQRAQDIAMNNHQFQTLNANIRRIHRQPDQLLAAGAANARHIQQQLAQPVAAGAVANNNATLSPTPRSLFELWNEWNTGIGGRKAAIHFTPQERGACKHKFTRRKRAWDIIRTMINKGHSAQTAIDRIYAVYGQGMPVTTILNRIAIDRRNNTLHPDFIA
jgi:hypothetical protein